MPDDTIKPAAPASAIGDTKTIAVAQTGPEFKVRDAAAVLKAAILEARQAGFVVEFNEGALDRIPISATAKALG